MAIGLLQIIILGLIQGAAELLPVSSSAHVVVAEKLMGIDPSTPAAMFLLVMLHTGTMLAVVAYFWRAWRRNYFSSLDRFASVAGMAILATALTGLLGYPLIRIIEKRFLDGGDVEQLARSLPLIAASLAAAGAVILAAGLRRGAGAAASGPEVTARSAAAMGFVQGLCLPFRGLSRSGTTISTGLLAGTGRRPAEEFSFALAVLITPPAILREAHRLFKDHPDAVHGAALGRLLAPGLAGMCCSFAAGLLALLWLSSWLEKGRWMYFGIYCLAAAALVAALAFTGF